ncbi:methionine ABC transporter ATP-binding protein [Candidatus Liberibacter sp.]|uniref:methionine ABC transporter ATP-binding protein n=1 Tax=Candidatus Liberibacter sp. TaxID=34022 RepID=UPI0015F71FC8|nr:ATP-binding cassette domain-containing protein [Candidatus Liberibacter sp.]MBA5724338.1 ATP-binding cassette domain-containing protein [Candidatus Liberibacter sp.]
MNQPPPIHRLISGTVSNPMVSFSDVTKTATSNHNTCDVISNVNCAIPRGKITGIIGHSGAGKSTLIRLINRLEQPTSGKVEVDGIDVHALDTDDLRRLRRRIGMIFQNFNLLSSRTVYENIALPLEITGMSLETIDSKVLPLLELVGLDDKKDFYPSTLSGGQKQRVGIARALATQPDLLLSDEATSALDPEMTISCLNLLKTINAQFGLSVLLVTHEMEVIKYATSHILVMNEGKIVESGKTVDIFKNPQHSITKSLLFNLPSYKLPEKISRQIHNKPTLNSYNVTRVSFSGDTVENPIISNLILEMNIDINILGGTIDEVAGESLGILVISYPSAVHISVQSFFDKHGLFTEVLGYVY